MAYDYLETDRWTRDFRRLLADRPRDAGNPEHATVRREDVEAAGLCDGEIDWLILTNRVASHHDARIIDERSVVHVRRHSRVRDAVLGLRREGPVSIQRLADLTGVSPQDALAVVKNMLDGPSAQASGWRWESPDRERPTDPRLYLAPRDGLDLPALELGDAAGNLGRPLGRQRRRLGLEGLEERLSELLPLVVGELLRLFKEIPSCRRHDG